MDDWEVEQFWNEPLTRQDLLAERQREAQAQQTLAGVREDLAAMGIPPEHHLRVMTELQTVGTNPEAFKVLQAHVRAGSAAATLTALAELKAKGMLQPPQVTHDGTP